MSTFGQTIKDFRLKKEWSQRKLALTSGISNTEINRIEKGERENPSLTVIQKLSAAFGITVDDLLAAAGITTRPATESTTKQKKPKELIQLIEQEDYTLNGQVATPEDREKLAKIIEALYWDAKEKNKRKK